ncbi:MAG TPA: DUF4124 domain-containing protein [Rhodocyclaceae bacterium]
MIRIAAFALLCVTALGASANTLYKCVDASGHATYTNNKDGHKNCAVLSRDGSSSSSGSKPLRSAAVATPSPKDFPKVSSEAQKGRDTDRRHILEQELASEQKNFDEAKKTLGDQEQAKAPTDRLQPLRDRMALHERNIGALKRELGNLR